MGTAWIRIGLVGLSALGAAACAGILGIDDRQLDTNLDGGSSGGSGGDSGGSSGGSSGGGSGSSSGGGSGGSSGSSSGGSSGSSSGSSSGGSGCADPCPMAMGLNHPFMMVADDSNVYWTEFGDDLNSTNGSVKSCPVSGCGAGPMVYAVLQANPRGIAVDSQNVYWGTAASGSINGAIWSCPIAGCTGGKPKMVAPANVPFQLALDNTYVYWADNYDDTVNRAPKAGGSDQVLNDAGGSLVLNNGQGCVVDSTYAYVTDYDYDLYRLPIAGGDLQAIYTQTMGQEGPAALTVDETHAYLGLQGSILQGPKTGMGTPLTIVSGVADPDDLKIDPATGMLYWSDWGSGTGTDGTVGKVPTDGGMFTLLHQAQVTPEAVAVTGTYLFWLSNGTIPAGSMTGAASPGTGILYRSAK